MSWDLGPRASPLQLEGALMYSKRMQLLIEGVARAASNGALRAFDDNRLHTLSTAFQAYHDAPLAYSEIPRLLTGTPPRSAPLGEDQINSAAAVIMSTDKWSGLKSPLLATSVFRDVQPNARALTLLRSMGDGHKKSKAFQSTVTFEAIMYDGVAAVNELNEQQAAARNEEETHLATVASARCHGRTRQPVLAQQNIAAAVGAGESTAGEKARRPHGVQANSPLHVCTQRGFVPCMAASNAERWFS